ncbi:MAG: hypothetical protein ABI431_05825 [Candidatus Tumulicola sp.]
MAGFVLAIALSAVAWRRSAATAGYYDGQVYGMTPGVHRRYAAIGIAFAAVFALAACLRFETAGIVALAVFTPVAIFYATSFVRGADDE